MKKKNNTYRQADGHIIGFTQNNLPFYIDNEDIDKVKDLYWNYDKDGYIVSNLYAKRILLHRFVLNNFDFSYDIDHINGDKKDNRKSNLRICTHQQNMMNQEVRKTNKLGIKGVYLENFTNKYVGHITYNGKIIKKRFDTLQEAISYRKELEDEYFGEYARKINKE